MGWLSVSFLVKAGEREWVHTVRVDELDISKATARGRRAIKKLFPESRVSFRQARFHEGGIPWSRERRTRVGGADRARSAS